MYHCELDSDGSNVHLLNFHGRAVNCKYTDLLLPGECPVVYHLVQSIQEQCSYSYNRAPWYHYVADICDRICCARTFPEHAVKNRYKRLLLSLQYGWSLIVQQLADPLQFLDLGEIHQQVKHMMCICLHICIFMNYCTNKSCILYSLSEIYVYCIAMSRHSAFDSELEHAQLKGSFPSSYIMTKGNEGFSPHIGRFKVQGSLRPFTTETLCRVENFCKSNN